MKHNAVADLRVVSRHRPSRIGGRYGERPRANASAIGILLGLGVFLGPGVFLDLGVSLGPGGAVGIGTPWGRVGAAEPQLLDDLDRALKASFTYEFGKDAGPLETAERLIVDAARDPQLRALAEERLLAAMAGPSTRDAKDFYSRQLRTVASARAAPVLEPMLIDPAFSHLARYVLEALEAPEVDAALVRALGKAPAKLQAGILGSLGRRHARNAVSAVVPFLGSDDPAVSRAATEALGAMGGAEAAKALSTARGAARGAKRIDIDDALLTCAEGFIQAKDGAAAATIYEGFLVPGEARHLRAGALRGLVLARGAAALPLLVKTLQGDDPELRGTAIELSRLVPGEEASKALAALVPTLPPEVRLLLIPALGERGDAGAAGAILAASKDEREDVRIAAWTALGAIGGGPAADPLLAAAAEKGGAEQAAARASLSRLSAAEAIPLLVARAASGDARVRVEALRVLADRRAKAAFEAVLGGAMDGDGSVRAAAIAALGKIGSAEHLEPLAALLAKPKAAEDRALLEASIAEVFGRIADGSLRAKALLGALGGAPAEAKPAILRLLSKSGAPEALAAAKAALADADSQVRAAALAALAAWPDAAPAEDLLALARSLPDEALRSIALRGFIRMAALAADPVSLYSKAMEAATTPADRKSVLEGLAGVGTAPTLEIVEARLGDAEPVGSAAALAAVQIADRIREKEADRSKEALARVLAASQDPVVRRKAQDVLAEFDKYEGFILAWMISGPYQEKGKESPAVLEAVFPPEDPQAKEVPWKRLRRGIGAWDINIETALDPLSHAAAYLKTSLWSPEAQDARLEFGSDDALRAWLGGKLVHSIYTNRGLAPRQDVVDVKLEKGWNELLVKVVNHAGPWGFCARVRKPDGGPIEGIKAEARP